MKSLLNPKRFQNSIGSWLQQYLSNYRFWIILLAVIISVAAGISGYFYPSTFSPLILGGLVFAGAMVLYWFKKPEWALYAAIFVVFIPGGLLPSQIQSYLNRALAVIAFATYFLNAIILRKKIEIRGSMIWMAAFVVWIITTLFWAENLSEGVTLIQKYVLRMLIFLFLIPNQIQTREKINGLMSVLRWMGWLFFVTGIYVLLFEGFTPGERFKILGMNENESGTLTLLAITGILWWVNQTSNKGNTSKIRGSMAIIYILFAIVIVALSGSRGGALSILISLLCYCFWKPTRKWGMISLFTLIFLASLTPLIFATTFERFLASDGGSILGGRGPIWQSAWLMIRDHLLLGVGIGNSRFAIMPYLASPQISNLYLPNDVWRVSSISIHNPVLLIWAETGLIGLTLYLGVLFSSVISFMKHFIDNSKKEIKFYFPLIFSLFFGFMVSWIKGGGAEAGTSYFLLLALLIIPVGMKNGRHFQAKTNGKILDSNNNQ